MASSDSIKPMRKHDSAVVLERLDASASSRYAVLLRQQTDHDESTSVVERGESNATPIGLDLTVRFGRVCVLMVLAVSTLATLTILFNNGVVIGHFDPTTKDADAQKKLLDDYNSYTGNVASIFGWPIEKFVALAVNVMLLRVLSSSLLRTAVSWKVQVATLVISAGIGYLISNGFNALNVQPQSPFIEPRIARADLSYVPDFSTTEAARRSTNFVESFPERSPRNPITNTVLRNLVLPRVPPTRLNCTTMRETVVLPEFVTEYGIPQRDWQSRLLQQALDPKTLHVIVNPTNKTANQSVDMKDLPMAASIAGDLFVYSMFAIEKFGWAPWSFLADNITLGSPHENVPAASFLGLLPPISSGLDEMAQREWLLRESTKALVRKLNETTNMSQTDVVMEFSHVDISPTLRFDAFSIEVEVDPSRVADVRSKRTPSWYNRADPESQCGSWSMRCLMSYANLTESPEPAAQVQVFAGCANANGAEVLSYVPIDNTSRLFDIKYEVQCPVISNSSLMVLSIGKRFVADSIAQNMTANSTGLFDDPTTATVKNLRRVYTYTIGKLSWDPSDLAADFNAECIEDGGLCHGLRVPLTDKSHQQELIVGLDALPSDSIPSFPITSPLVELHEFRSTTGDKAPLSVDPLLPHNVGEIQWDVDHPLPDPRYCSTRVVNHVQLVFNNHMYIEHGLQAAYTAATFFLFQNGVVKDVIKLNATSTSLNFQQNRQTIALLASIPDQNARLTLGGCVALVVSLCCVILWAWGSTTSGGSNGRCGGLGLVTTPHVVARIMMDSTQFPPSFLHCRVGGTQALDAKSTDGFDSVDGFVIDGLTLQPESANRV